VVSGRRFSYEVNRSTSASAATLFRIAADDANYSKWAKPVIMQSSLVCEGDPAPWGIGAVRKVGAWPLFGLEETVRYEEGRCFAYKLNEPAPVMNYVGEVKLSPNAAGGTEISWSGSFVEKVHGTGPFVRAAYRGVVRFYARRLVKVAEREDGQ
jgi:hypothetical protein